MDNLSPVTRAMQRLWAASEEATCPEDMLDWTHVDQAAAYLARQETPAPDHRKGAPHDPLGGARPSPRKQERMRQQIALTNETYWGTIQALADAMVARWHDATALTDDPVDVTALFNGIPLHYTGDGEALTLVRAYHTAWDAQAAARRATPASQAEQAATAAHQARHQALFAGALCAAPAFLLRDPAFWADQRQVNTDPYGARVVQYAEDWARLMQGRMASGDTIEACAQPTSLLANTHGITGYMYGCAVQLLAHCWVHGEALRRWHNTTTQSGDEGERANATGGVLNPALVVVERAQV